VTLPLGLDSWPLCCSFLLFSPALHHRRTKTTPDSDDAELACEHFRNIAGDFSAGLLTDSELREKLKEVYDNSIIAGSRIRRAAQDMLAASTAGDDGALADAVTRMAEARSAASG
jgi:hypothetical protein